MKKCSSALTFALAIILVLTLLPATSFAEEGDPVFAGGSGTKEDPWLIATAEQLSSIPSNTTDYFKLIEDIVFTEEDFAPGGPFYNDGRGFPSISGFGGIFDGDGHVIFGLYQNNRYVGGLFDSNKYYWSAAIKNLGMVNCSIIVVNPAQEPDGSSMVEAGALVGYVKYGSVTIENCYQTGTVSGQNSAYVGGLVGRVRDSGTVALTNCRNLGRVESSGELGAAGGMIGYVDGAYKEEIRVTITGCYNEGFVRAPVSAGGMVGEHFPAFRSKSSLYIENCGNSGTVHSYYAAGGIIGRNRTTPYYDSSSLFTMQSCDVKSCWNAGVVRGRTIGGIAGTFDDCGHIRNCYNAGYICGEGSYVEAGGIVGSIGLSGLGDKDGSVSLNYCYNVGPVEATWDGITSASSAGLVAYTYRYGGLISINNCKYLDTEKKGVGGALEGAGGYAKCTAEEMKTLDGLSDAYMLDGRSLYPYPQLKTNPMTKIPPVILTARQENGVVSYDLFSVLPGQAQVIVAQYSAEGRMKAVRVVFIAAVDQVGAQEDAVFTHGEGDTYRVFAVDPATMQPLSGSVPAN